MLCIIIDQYCLLSFLCQPNIPKFRGEYFAIQTLFAQVALGDYNIIVHEKHALHITQVCIPCNSGDIISNLLLSRAYFPHLFHKISAKAKKLQLLSENLQEVAAVGWAYFGYLLKYAQGQRLTHAVAISHWNLTLAHAVMLPKYAPKKNSRGPGQTSRARGWTRTHTIHAVNVM